MKIRIYIPDEDVYGEVVSEGAYASVVEYSLGGILYNVVMLNEDFVVVEEIEE